MMCDLDKTISGRKAKKKKCKFAKNRCFQRKANIYAYT